MAGRIILILPIRPSWIVCACTLAQDCESQTGQHAVLPYRTGKPQGQAIGGSYHLSMLFGLPSLRIWYEIEAFHSVGGLLTMFRPGSHERRGHLDVFSRPNGQSEHTHGRHYYCALRRRRRHWGNSCCFPRGASRPQANARSGKHGPYHRHCSHGLRFLEGAIHGGSHPDWHWCWLLHVSDACVSVRDQQSFASRMAGMLSDNDDAFWHYDFVLGE